MRFSSICLGVTLSALAVGAIGCNTRSQLVVGIITNLRVKGELSNVQMDLTRENVLFQSYNWDISDQQALNFVLPGSFTLFSDNGGAPVAGVTVTGFKGDAVKVVRTATIQLQPEADVFYRMSLVFKCTVGMPSASSQCPEDFGCIEGICKPNAVSGKTFKPFTATRVGNVECDSGTQYISTGTCSSGTCAPMPSTGETCAVGEFCSEGTCYARDPAAPRLLEYGEACDPSTTDGCRESGLSCAATQTGDRARCHQDCMADSDCTRLLPDARATGVSKTEAHCTHATPSSKPECTFACDALNTTDGGCLSGTTCQIIEISSPSTTEPFGPECSTVHSNVVPAMLGAPCTSDVGSCGTGAVCITNTTTKLTNCRKLCKLSIGGCTSPQTCTALVNTASVPSNTWGVCQ